MTEAADQMRNKRHREALPGGGHDKVVHFLARALPAAVGVIVAIMVIAPLFPRGEVSFLLDRNKVATTKDRIKVESAMYRGEDAKGRPFSLTAGQAVQPNAQQSVIELTNLAAKMLLADGPAELSAPGGTFDFNANTMAVKGAVDFRAAGGYRMTTSNVSIDLKGQHVTGAGGVAGSVPSGTFTADRLDADLDARTVTLTGRARLRMVPGKMKVPKN